MNNTKINPSLNFCKSKTAANRAFRILSYPLKSMPIDQMKKVANRQIWLSKLISKFNNFFNL